VNHHSVAASLVHVCCGQMAGWMKTPLGTEVDLGPGHIVLDGDHRERGTAPPSFRPKSVVAKVVHLSYCLLSSLWLPSVADAGIIFLSCFLFVLFFPHLISVVGDWMSTILLHSANLECRSVMCCTRLAGYVGPKNSPSGHHHTTLLDYIFATKARIDNRKKSLLNTNVSPHVLTIW